MLKINKKFAKKYDDYRRKEELQKFKDRFGDVKLSEAQKRAAEPTEPGASGGSGSSSSTSDDSDCEAWTPGMEAEFLRVYAALHTGDARLYDPAVSWFQEAAEGDDDDDEDEGEGKEGQNGDAGKVEERHKPMYFNEYHRKYLLEGAYENEDQTGGAAAPEATDGDLQEAERIRKSLAESHAKQLEDDEDNSDEDEANGADAFLVKRHRLGGANAGADDPMLRLHKFVSDEADDGGGLEPACKEDLAKLKRHWANPSVGGADGSGSSLSAAERYLRDYITKEYWRRPQERGQLKPDADVEEEDNEEQEEEEDKLSEDEEFLARQSQFEAKWNERTESRDAEFESGFRRTFALGEEGQEVDDEDNDDELFVAKKKQINDSSQVEIEHDQEVTNELLRLERRRDSKRKLDSIDDDGDEAEEDDAEIPGGGDAVVVRSYPRRIADSLRQATTADARARQRAERRERRLAEKASRRREFDRLAKMKSEELHQRLERLRRNAGVSGDGPEDRVADVLGGDFLEADFDPGEHDRRMAGLFDREFYGENGELGEGRRRPEFSDDEEVGDDGEDGEALRRRLQAKADGLGAEDLIRCGPGQADLPCRFNYRQVEPNDFGLSAVEILLADDRELNAWCSVRKASQYREREADRRDRRRFHSARVQERKAQLLPGMLKRLEATAAFRDANSWAKAAAAAAAAGTEDGVPMAMTAEDDADATKKRRRKKKKMQTTTTRTTGNKSRNTADANDGAEDAEQTPRSRKKPTKKMKLDIAAAAVPVQAPTEARKPEKKQQEQQEKMKKKKKKGNKSAPDRLQISEQRLLELGIDPKKFRRIRRSKLAETKAAAFVSVDD